MKIVKIVMLIIAFGAKASLYAQTATDAFISVPESVLLDLTTNKRMDLIDLHNANQKAIVLNNFGDSISIKSLNDNYLFLEKGNSSLQIIVLPMINESKLYCLIHTNCAPICDSQIEFYSINWIKLDSKTFISPVDKKWFINEEFPSLELSLMQFIYDSETLSLQQKYNIQKDLSPENQLEVKPLLNEEKIYKWNGIRFE